MIFATSTPNIVNHSMHKSNTHQVGNLKIPTPAGKSPFCFWDSWIGEGNLKLGFAFCQRPRDWFQNPALQHTPWNSTLSSVETAQGQGTQTQSTPNSTLTLTPPNCAESLRKTPSCPYHTSFTPSLYNINAVTDEEKHHAQSKCKQLTV